MTTYYGKDYSKIFENIEVRDGWKEFFNDCKEEFEFINDILTRKSRFQTFIPVEKNVFRIFKNLDVDEIKVVILGQDPYPEVKTVNDKMIPRACGFAFSSPLFKLPLSLRVIFCEIEKTEGKCVKNPSGDLLHWVNQGVFLLNTYLTTSYDPVNNKGFPEEHRVWTCFTSKVISYIARKTDAIFLIWGDKAKKLVEPYLSKRNKVFYSTHPAADMYGKTKFLGCNHFKNVNTILDEPIMWKPLEKPLDDKYY